MLLLASIKLHSASIGFSVVTLRKTMFANHICSCSLLQVGGKRQRRHQIDTLALWHLKSPEDVRVLAALSCLNGCLRPTRPVHCRPSRSPKHLSLQQAWRSILRGKPQMNCFVLVQLLGPFLRLVRVTSGETALKGP